MDGNEAVSEHSPHTHNHWHYSIRGEITTAIECQDDLFTAMTFAIGGLVDYMEKNNFSDRLAEHLASLAVRVGEDLELVRESHGFAWYMQGMTYMVTWQPEARTRCPLTSTSTNVVPLQRRKGVKSSEPSGS